MSKINTVVADAFFNLNEATIGNTTVRVDALGATVRLHGNAIYNATLTGFCLEVSDCGRRTPTTRSRLNAILRLFGLPKLRQAKEAWCFDGVNGSKGEEFTGYKIFDLGSRP